MIAIIELQALTEEITGEKRLVAYVLAKCPKHPPDFEARVNELLSAIAPAGQLDALGKVHELLDGLDDLLIEEQLMTPKTSRQANA